MKNISTRKLRRFVRKYKAFVIAAAAVLVVGLGLLVSNVLAQSPSISFTPSGTTLVWNSTYSAYQFESQNTNYSFKTSFNGDLGGATTDQLNQIQVDWSSSRPTLISAVSDNSNASVKDVGIVTPLGAGYAKITASTTAQIGSSSVTAGSQNVYLPLVSSMIALKDNKKISSSSEFGSSELYSVGDSFTITGDNVIAENPLRYHFYRDGLTSDGKEITQDSGLGDDVTVTSTDTSVTFSFNKGGCYRIEVCTKDYDDDNGGAGKIKELCNTYRVWIKPEFAAEDTTTTDNVDYVIIQKTAGGTKYVKLDDVTKPYAILTNLSTHGTPLNYGVRWKSSDTSIATVVNAGSSGGSSIYNMVQGGYAGVATITQSIYSKDVSNSEYSVSSTESDIKVVIPFIWAMDDIKTNADGSADKEVKMNVGDTYVLSTTGRSVAYFGEDEDGEPATFTQDGTKAVFQPTKKGTYTFTATIKNPADYSLTEFADMMGVTTLTVTIHVIDSFSLSEDTHTLKTGDSFDLRALVTDADADVTFTYEQVTGVNEKPSTEALVKLETYVPDGETKATAVTVTGVKAGYARITATQKVNGVEKSASCLVTIVESVSDLTIDPSSIEVVAGQGATLNIIFNGNDSIPDNQTVTWTTSDTSLLTVEPYGNGVSAQITSVDANKGGDVTVMAISEDGLKVGTCKVHIRVPVTGITLNRSEVTGALKDGQFQLSATITPSGDGVNRNVKWTSTNESVLKVDENGLVTYVGTGYASIMAETEDGGADGEGFKTFCNFYINVPVESLKLDCGQEVIMSINEEKRITAEVLPITASQRTISWQSSNTSVCTVDSNGLVTAVGHGNATILAKTIDGSNLTAMANIYVKQPVEQVVLSTHEITVRKGTEFWLNATCLPESADNKICSWTTSNSEVCTVASDGKVTATGSGTCNIVVTNDDTGISDYCVVTVTQPVTGLNLNSDYQLMWVGAKYAIIPEVLPTDADNKKCTFESSDETVATVDEDGIVTALKGGSCVIIVTTDELSLKASVTIDVKEYVSSVKLSESDKYMNVGATGKLTVTVGSDTATNKNVVWSSSNNGIVGVVDGNLYAYSVGNAVITATAADGSGVSDTCIVKVVKPVESISIEPSEVKILVGDSYKLKGNVTPSDATVQDLRWESSNDAIATVDSDGEVTGVAVGKVKITAYATDGNDVKASCSVYVSPVVKITSLKINSSEITMLVGKTRQLQAFVTPTNHTESVNWYSTDTSIVSVDQNGNITTVGPGIADVVVQGGTSNIQTTCRVHALALSKNTINLGQYDWFDLAVDGSSGFTVSWRTSNPRVATVDSTGHVVARMRGTTTITATVDNKTLTCVVNVGDLY